MNFLFLNLIVEIMYRRLIFGLIFIWIIGLRLSAQDVALKTNVLYWMTTTPNAAVEVAFSKKVTANIAAAYNPWTFSNGKKMRFWMVQPETRYWLCEKFEGHYLGVHLHAAQYYGGFSKKRYDGYLAGGGFSYGYNWILSPHWNMEASIGIGYARLWYKESERIYCEKCYENKTKNYVGPTQVAFSFSYIF